VSNLVSKILTAILYKVMSETFFCQVMANGLEALVKSTKNEIDDKIAQPLIDVLRS